MSVHISSACKKLDYTGAKREVLLEFADHANDDGICWPSRSRIMYNTGLSESAVKQQMKELRDAEVLVVVDQHEGGRGKVPIYRVQPEKGPQKIPFSEWCDARRKGSKGSSDDRQRGHTVAPEPSGEPPSNGVEDSLHSTSTPAESEKQDDGKDKVVPAGKFFTGVLMDAVTAAEKSGAQVHPPPNVGRIGARFRELAKKHDTPTLEAAVTYMVAKACGEVEGEPKAWCGPDRAVDAVLSGWEVEVPAPEPPLYEFTEEEYREHAIFRIRSRSRNKKLWPQDTQEMEVYGITISELWPGEEDQVRIVADDIRDGLR